MAVTLDTATGNYNAKVFGDKGSDSIEILGGNSGTTVYGDNTGSEAAGNDTIYLATTAATKLELRGNGGNDKFAAAIEVTSSTINAGVGNDTIAFSELSANALTGSKVYLGDGNDSFTSASTKTVNVTASTITGGAGNDTFDFTTGASGISVVGGTGDDSIKFGAGQTTTGATATGATSGLTYFYGFGDGNDTFTLTKSTTALGQGFTVAVSAQYGSTGVFSGGAGADGLVTLGGGNTLTFDANLSGLVQGAGLNAVTMITVSQASITSLG